MIIEVYGHDHYADLRYHSSDNVASLPNVEEDFYFHNMFVAPGVTRYEGTNSGVSMFKINDDLVPYNLRLEFINVEQTYGRESVNYEDLEFNSIDFADDFGLQEIDAKSLHRFKERLDDN